MDDGGFAIAHYTRLKGRTHNALKGLFSSPIRSCTELAQLALLYRRRGRDEGLRGSPLALPSHDGVQPKGTIALASSFLLPPHDKQAPETR